MGNGIGELHDVVAPSPVADEQGEDLAAHGSYDSDFPSDEEPNATDMEDTLVPKSIPSSRTTKGKTTSTAPASSSKKPGAQKRVEARGRSKRSGHFLRIVLKFAGHPVGMTARVFTGSDPFLKDVRDVVKDTIGGLSLGLRNSLFRRASRSSSSSLNTSSRDQAPPLAVVGSPGGCESLVAGVFDILM
ncbi:hypothetical protein E4U30_006491 [Claviceps sp. LM220 group G6]|nr:hypothetical protein E4U15_007423 [Claviceps sp. LM218 group G6]KAG6091644.1 hypothetical protein E4U30_006491 [Claviceps sp. LM220 group G6]